MLISSLRPRLCRVARGDLDAGVEAPLGAERRGRRFDDQARLTGGQRAQAASENVPAARLSSSNE